MLVKIYIQMSTIGGTLLSAVELCGADRLILFNLYNYTFLLFILYYVGN